MSVERMVALSDLLTSPYHTSLSFFFVRAIFYSLSLFALIFRDGAIGSNRLPTALFPLHLVRHVTAPGLPLEPHVRAMERGTLQCGGCGEAGTLSAGDQYRSYISTFMSLISPTHITPLSAGQWGHLDLSPGGYLDQGSRSRGGLQTLLHNLAIFNHAGEGAGRTLVGHTHVPNMALKLGW